jgi:NADH:ubiquinone oxidoreductase subunit 4 (subunit M)
VVLVALGVYPQPVIRTFQPAMQAIQQFANAPGEVPPR